MNKSRIIRVHEDFVKELDNMMAEYRKSTDYLGDMSRVKLTKIVARKLRRRKKRDSIASYLFG